jgi:hypothetical protein
MREQRDDEPGGSLQAVGLRQQGDQLDEAFGQLGRGEDEEPTAALADDALELLQARRAYDEGGLGVAAHARWIAFALTFFVLQLL